MSTEGDYLPLTIMEGEWPCYHCLSSLLLSCTSPSPSLLFPPSLFTQRKVQKAQAVNMAGWPLFCHFGILPGILYSWLENDQSTKYLRGSVLVELNSLDQISYFVSLHWVVSRYYMLIRFLVWVHNKDMIIFSIWRILLFDYLNIFVELFFHCKIIGLNHTHFLIHYFNFLINSIFPFLFYTLFVHLRFLWH